MTRDQVERAADRELDSIEQQRENGILTEEEYRQALRDLQRDIRDAEREAQAEWMERGGWGR